MIFKSVKNTQMLAHF